MNVSEKLIQDLKKQTSLLKLNIAKEIEILPKTNRGLQSTEILQILEECNNVYSFSFDVRAGINEFKEEVGSIVSSLKQL